MAYAQQQQYTSSQRPKGQQVQFFQETSNHYYGEEYAYDDGRVNGYREPSKRYLANRGGQNSYKSSHEGYVDGWDGLQDNENYDQRHGERDGTMLDGPQLTPQGHYPLFVNEYQRERKPQPKPYLPQKHDYLPNDYTYQQQKGQLHPISNGRRDIYLHAEQSKMDHTREQGHTGQGSISPRQKLSKMTETPISPNALAWDNPFPTFPLTGKIRSGRNDSEDLVDREPGDPLRCRPQPDNLVGKVLQHSGGESLPIKSAFREETMRNGDSFADHKPLSDRPFVDKLDKDTSTVDRVTPSRHEQKLRPPAMYSRHSEENHVRPKAAITTDLDSTYERSRTMPTTISDLAPNVGLRSTSANEAFRQEPGSVAGYYGPEDKEFLPISRGERLTPQQSGKRFLKTGHQKSYDNQTPHDQEIKFDELSYERYPNTTQKLEPGLDTNSHQPSGTLNKLHSNARSTRQDVSSTQEHMARDWHRDGRNARAHDVYNSSRSRSQPNVRDRRSPMPQNDRGIHFGMPSHGQRRAETEPASREGQNRPRLAADYSNQQSTWRDFETSVSAKRTPTDYFPKGWDSARGPVTHQEPPEDVYSDRFQYSPAPSVRSNRAQLSRPAHPRPRANQDSAHPGRHRTPPTQQVGSFQISNGGFGGRTPPTDRTEPTQAPLKSLSTNPDALPIHPVPFRPGLSNGTTDHPSKPIPARQYSATASRYDRPEPTRRGSVPITHKGLETLKTEAARSPNSPSSQMALAKGLVEAASALIDKEADPRVKSKAREQNVMEAYRIVKKLSSSGHPEANFYLADAYSRGALGLECDAREAFKLYQAAAKANHSQAAYRVAVCCEIGQEEGGGTARDPVKAMQWYNRAATLGDTPAMYKMGIISLKGLLGQAKNPRDALIWLNKAAERSDEENPHALHELALLHENPSPSDGVKKDEFRALQLFKQAADLGYKFSQFRLGCVYEYALLGCATDARQSIAWFSKAAVQEEHQSELALSGWYLTGAEGILQQSDTEAYLWARKAAQAGLAKAEYAMGYFTEVGIGAPANLEDAKRWYWRAASQNFQKARDRLEELRRGGAIKGRPRVSRSNMKKQSDGECVIM